MNEYEAVDWSISFRCDNACCRVGADVLRAALTSHFSLYLLVWMTSCLWINLRDLPHLG